MIKVYLAGKIGINDWRHDLFGDLNDYDFDHGGWAKVDIIENCVSGQFKYVGPFFISNFGHGVGHGDNSHGRREVTEANIDHYIEDKKEKYKYQSDLRKDREDVVSLCTHWLNEADIVFVWLDENDAYGTLVEIGMAKQMGKPIFFAMPIGFDPYKDMWFAWTLANISVMAVNPTQAWSMFETIAERLLPSAGLSYTVDKHLMIDNVKTKK